MKIIGLLGQAGVGKDTVAAMVAPVHLVFLNGSVVDIRTKVKNEATAALPDAPPLGTHAIQVGLADPLKEFCHHVYGFSLEQLWGPSEARNRPDQRFPREYREHRPDRGTCNRCGDPSAASCFSYLTPREALQQLGTEWGRSLYSETWVDLLLRRIEMFAARAPERPAQAHAFVNSWVVPRVETVVVSDCRFINEIAVLSERRHAVWRVERNQKNGSVSNHLSEQEQTSDEAAGYVQHVIDNNGTFANLRSKVREALATLR